MRSKEFRGEIWTNVDERVLDAIVRANSEAVDGCVGGDSHSLRAEALVQAQLKERIYTTCTINGTGANIIALKAMTGRCDAIVCARETHINVYEAGATEFTLGNKILAIDSDDAKLTPERIDAYLTLNRKYKYNPRVLVITQPTELGFLYSVDELTRLCSYAHAHDMFVYIDGARLGHALAALNCTLHEMIELPDVDAFSIGGTKAGAMFGEMVVFRRKEFARNLPYLVKQSFQHFDKSKFLGVQMECLLEGDLWLENAAKANANAKRLERAFAQKGYAAVYPVETNMVFIRLTDDELARLNEVYDLHYWNEANKSVRFAATANTSEDEIMRLAAML